MIWGTLMTHETSICSTCVIFLLPRDTLGSCGLQGCSLSLHRPGMRDDSPLFHHEILTFRNWKTQPCGCKTSEHQTQSILLKDIEG
eukprot:s189_g8.t1